MNEFQAQLLSTVHWSLGITGTLVALLVGFSWFVNFRVYDRDKHALTQELRAHVDSMMAALRTDLDTQHKESLKQMSSAATAAAETSARAIRNELETLKRELRDAKIELLTAEADSWEQKKVYSNELLVRAQLLEAVIESASSWRISGILDDISTRLREWKDGAISQKISAASASRLTKALAKLPSEFSVTITSITGLLTQIPQG